MCGLFGFSRAPRTSIVNGREFALDGLVSIEDRGHHATGAGWTIKRDRSQAFFSSLEGRASRVAQRLPIDKRGVQTLVGHTRWATHGPSSDAANRHPVVCDGIVATHNGVLSNHLSLIKQAGVVNPGVVDSFAIPAILANLHRFEAEHPVDVLSLVEGDAALAWIDASDHDALHLARLAGRPLAIGWTKRGDLIYASTPAALFWLSHVADTKITGVETLGEGDYVRIEAGEIVDYRTIKVNRKPRPVYAAPAPSGRRSGARHLRSTPKVVTQPALPPARGYMHGVTDWWDEAEAALGRDAMRQQGG